MKFNSKVPAILMAVLLLLASGLPLWSESSGDAENTPGEVQTEGEVTSDVPVLSDTLKVVSDSLKTKAGSPDSLFYAADSIAFKYDTEQIYLYGKTSIKYTNSTIMADSLEIDLKKDQAFSNGRTVMLDGDQVLIGNQVFYDVNSQTGMMYNGESKMEKGFYYGDEIRKVGTDIYDVDGGRFTTCDDPDPDFWFWSKQMRLYKGDKIVSKPVVAYVNHLPIFYFPFMTFSIKKGRQAGLLIPEPGYNPVDGKFIRNVAFFYPYKEYADATMGFDLMEKTGWKANLETRYIKRYLYNGDFQFAWQKRISDTITNNDYLVNGNHHQELGDKATLDANIDYVSNKRIWDTSTDINEALARRITSSVSYRKPVASSYLNVGATYSEDLINKTANLTLPSGSYSLPTRPVYEIFSGKETGNTNKTAWWTNFNYSYNVRLDHTGDLNQKAHTLEDLIWNNDKDSTGAFLNEHHIGIKHNAGLNYNYKAFGWLNLTQGFNYDEAWMDRDRNGVKWVRGDDYSASTSANLTMYGMKTFPGAYISAVRHIVTPSASFSYGPDFSDNAKFYSFGGIILNQGEKSRFIGLNLDQKWQMKLRATDKLKERKLNDILSWTTRSGINLEDKDKHNVADFTHTFTFRPAVYENKKFKVTYTAGYNLSQTPYQLHWLDWKFKNQYFTHTINIGGNAKYIDYFPRKQNMMFTQYLAEPDSSVSSMGEQAPISNQESWSMSLTQDMSADRNMIHPRNNNLKFSATVKITSNWSLVYSNYYNVTQSQTLSQSFDISRTLHCWKLNISYTRRNNFWDYRIVFMNVSLPDALKFQTHDTKRF